MADGLARPEATGARRSLRAAGGNRRRVASDAESEQARRDFSLARGTPDRSQDPQVPHRGEARPAGLGTAFTIATRHFDRFPHLLDVTSLQPSLASATAASAIAADAAMVTELHDAHGVALYDFARHLGLSDEQAADALQEPILRLWRELRRGTLIERPPAWLYRTLYRLAMEQHRWREVRLPVPYPSPLTRAHRCAAGR